MNAQYDQAVRQELVHGGSTEVEATHMADQAAQQMALINFDPEDFVPIVPGRIGQSKRSSP